MEKEEKKERESEEEVEGGEGDRRKEWRVTTLTLHHVRSVYLYNVNSRKYAPFEQTPSPLYNPQVLTKVLFSHAPYRVSSGNA